MTDLNNTELNLNEMELAAGGRVGAGKTETAAKPLPRHGFVIHTITANESLEQIAERFDTTVSEILAANPAVKDKKLIRTGVTLNIPQRNA